MIEVRQNGPVAVVTLARSERRNALTPEMTGALTGELRHLEAEPACRVIVLRGAGGHFCSGRELVPAEEQRTLEEVLAFDERWTDLYRVLDALRTPTIASVEGYAVAGGFTLAMACDFVLAEEGARFGALEMANGFPAAINTVVLAHRALPRHALELLLSAETRPAADLVPMGLVNRVVPGAAALEAATAQLAERLAALDPTAVQLTKETLRTAQSMPRGEALTLGKNVNALLLASGRIDAAGRAFAARKKDSSSN